MEAPASACPSEDDVIGRFERGFFLCDSTAEDHVTVLARLDGEHDGVPSRSAIDDGEGKAAKSPSPLLLLYAAMVKLWGRRQHNFDEASKIYHYLMKLKKERGVVKFTPKEETHLEALRLFLSRNYRGVVDHYRRYLKEIDPSDTVVLRMLILCQFFSGCAAELFDICESVRDANSDCQTFMCLYCMLASFSGKIPPSRLESVWSEEGMASSSEWTVHHAGAHILVTRPLQDMIDYMEKAGQSWGDNVGQGYRSHGFFHLALLYVFNGEPQRAKALYHSEVWPAGHPSRSALLCQMNAIGFLWVLHLADPNSVSVEDWDDIAKEILREGLHQDDLGILSLLMASCCLHLSGRKTVALECVDTMAKRSGDPVSTKVGLNLLRGCIAFCDGRYEEASRLLAPHASDEDSECIGGSDEQRLPLWYTYIASLSQTPNVSQSHLRSCIMKQVKRQERDIWPMEARWLETTKDR